MPRWTVSTMEVAVAVLLLSLASGCGGDDGGGMPSAPCNEDRICDGAYSGTAFGPYICSSSRIRLTVTDNTVSFSHFEADCYRLRPYCEGCWTRVGSDSIPIDNNCNFRVQFVDSSTPYGTAVNEVRGTLDTDTCSISGRFDFTYGTCCTQGADWHASK